MSTRTVRPASITLEAIILNRSLSFPEIQEQLQNYIDQKLRELHENVVYQSEQGSSSKLLQQAKLLEKIHKQFLKIIRSDAKTVKQQNKKDSRILLSSKEKQLYKDLFNKAFLVMTFKYGLFKAYLLKLMNKHFLDKRRKALLALKLKRKKRAKRLMQETLQNSEIQDNPKSKTMAETFQGDSAEKLLRQKYNGIMDLIPSSGPYALSLEDLTEIDAQVEVVGDNLVNVFQAMLSAFEAASQTLTHLPKPILASLQTLLTINSQDLISMKKALFEFDVIPKEPIEMQQFFYTHILQRLETMFQQTNTLLNQTHDATKIVVNGAFNLVADNLMNFLQGQPAPSYSQEFLAQHTNKWQQQLTATSVEPETEIDKMITLKEMASAEAIKAKGQNSQTLPMAHLYWDKNKGKGKPELAPEEQRQRPKPSHPASP